MPVTRTAWLGATPSPNVPPRYSDNSSWRTGRRRARRVRSPRRSRTARRTAVQSPCTGCETSDGRDIGRARRRDPHLPGGRRLLGESRLDDARLVVGEAGERSARLAPKRDETRAPCDGTPSPRARRAPGAGRRAMRRCGRRLALRSRSMSGRRRADRRQRTSPRGRCPGATRRTPPAGCAILMTSYLHSDYWSPRPSALQIRRQREKLIERSLENGRVR
jgi:hypothetical protein